MPNGRWLCHHVCPFCAPGGDASVRHGFISVASERCGDADDTVALNFHVEPGPAVVNFATDNEFEAEVPVFDALAGVYPIAVEAGGGLLW